MGCKFSEPQIISEHQELLGCCWEADHSHGDANAFGAGGAWYPYDPKDPGKRHCHAFRVQRGVLSAERNDYLSKHNLGVSAGVGCVDRRNVNTVSISDSTIKQCTTSGVGFRAHGSLSYVSLGGEFARAKEAGPGSSMSLTIIVVQCHEVSIDPSQHAHYKYERSPVNTNSVLPNARRLYGEGVVSNVLYGGYLVIETSQENYEAMQRGFAVRGDLQVGAGGGGVDVGFANTKIEGAKSTNFNVRCYGGKNITCNFTNCPIEKILRMVDDWANDLLRNRHKALPIAIRLATYSGIENYVLQLGSDWEDAGQKTKVPTIEPKKNDADAVRDEEARVLARIQKRQEEEAMQHHRSDSDAHSPFGRTSTNTFISESGIDVHCEEKHDSAGAKEEKRDSAPTTLRKEEALAQTLPMAQPAQPVATETSGLGSSGIPQSQPPPAETSGLDISDDSIDHRLAVEEYHAACRELEEAKLATAQLQAKLQADEARLDKLFQLFFPCPPRAHDKMLHFLAASIASTRDVKLQVEHLRSAAAILTHPKCSLRIMELSSEGAAMTDSQAGLLAGFVAHRNCTSLNDLYLVNHHVSETGAAALIASTLDHYERRHAAKSNPMSFSLYLEANALPKDGEAPKVPEYEHVLQKAKSVPGFRVYV